jgi:hypothetical protein
LYYVSCVLICDGMIVRCKLGTRSSDVGKRTAEGRPSVLSVCSHPTVAGGFHGNAARRVRAQGPVRSPSRRERHATVCSSENGASRKSRDLEPTYCSAFQCSPLIVNLMQSQPEVSSSLCISVSLYGLVNEIERSVLGRCNQCQQYAR